MRRIYHQRSLCHCRVVGNISHESFHFPDAVQHCIIHVYVNDAGSILDLFSCNLECLFVLALGNQSGELPRSGNVGSFSDIREIVLLHIHSHSLQTAHLKDFVHENTIICGSAGSGGQMSWCYAFQCTGNGAYMFRTGSAASAGNVYEASGGHALYCYGHL